jgi:hypothetical protein
MDVPLASFLLVDCEVNAPSILHLGAPLAHDSLASTALIQADKIVPSPSGMLSIAPPLPTLHEMKLLDQVACSA